MTAGAWAVLLGTWAVAVASPGPDFVAVLRGSMAGGTARGLRVAAGVVAGIAVWIAAALIGIVALISSHPTVFLAVRWAGAVFLVLYGGYILIALVRARKQKSGHVGDPEADRARDRAGSASTGSSGPGSASESTTGSTSAQVPTSTQVAASAQVPTSTQVPASAPGTAPAPASAPGTTPAPAPAPASTSTPARSGWADVRLGFLTNTVGNPKAVVFFGALFAGILPAGIEAGESVAVGLAMAGIALVFFAALAFATGRPLVIRAYERAQTLIDTVVGLVFIVLGLALLPWGGV
ncbi:LysE family translocator [Brevibacterium pityocampae]|uniref:LysE family translocator n=1 Tax=Brevibacterium pityocampae TaxID=506594 RepID=A0ABP8JJS8_9MICO